MTKKDWGIGSEFNADNVLVAASFGELDDLHFVASCYNIDNATAYSSRNWVRKLWKLPRRAARLWSASERLKRQSY